MPDRHRRTLSNLRFIPRPKHRTFTAVSVRSESPSAHTGQSGRVQDSVQFDELTSADRDAVSAASYLLPSEHARTQSLQPAPVCHTPTSTRQCDSLPPDWQVRERSRRNGRRVSPQFAEVFAFCDQVSDQDCDAFDEMHSTPSTASTARCEEVQSESQCSQEKQMKHVDSEMTKLLLDELRQLRRHHEESHAALSAALTAQNAHVMQLEATVASMKKASKARPAQVLLRGVLDAIAAVLLALFVWCVATPLGRVRQLARKKTSVRMRRKSWRLSGEDVLLNSAAKRLSLTVDGIGST